MAIMAAQGQSDARGAAWLLADVAISSLQDPSTGPNRTNELNNVYRLIQAYRNHPLFGLESTIGSGSSDVDGLSMSSPSEHHVLGVREAMKRAAQLVYANEAVDKVFDDLRKVLRSLAVLGSAAPVHEAEYIHATRFFNELRNHLSWEH